jgi:hypothetical protein
LSGDQARPIQLDFRAIRWTTTKILDLGQNDQTISNQIAVLPRQGGETQSTLVNVFDWIYNDNKQGRKGEKISAMWSTDSGATWSDPVVIDPIAGAVPLDRDPDGAPCPEQIGHKFDPYVCRLRTSDGGPDVAVDPITGSVYVAWQDGGPDGKVVIRLAKSTDHGQSWDQLGVVNTVPSTDAHTPSVEVNEEGNVALTYYDFRFNDVDSTDGLETAHWIRRSATGGESFGPDELLGTTFDTRKRPTRSATSWATTTDWGRSEPRSSRSGPRHRARPPASRCWTEASTRLTVRTSSRPRHRRRTRCGAEQEFRKAPVTMIRRRVSLPDPQSVVARTNRAANPTFGRPGSGCCFSSKAAISGVTRPGLIGFGDAMDPIEPIPEQKLSQIPDEE